MTTRWLAVLVLVAGAGLAEADPGGPRGPRDVDVRQQLEEAGLSAEQIEQLRKIRADEQKASLRMRAELKVARLELRELLDATAVDPAAIEARMKRIGELEAALLKARVDARLAVRGVMTPEQHEKVKLVRPPRHDRLDPPRTTHPEGDEEQEDEEDR
jgi:Spy/CpxP family protein refolding chaperone